MAPVGAMSADQSVKAGFDCLNRIYRFDEDPHLDHGTSLGVLGTSGETCCDNDAVAILVDDVTVW